MPLGNSITQADALHPGYRYELWKLLKDSGHNFDFVGSMKDNYRGENPVQSFDTDHEGHWGWRADQVLNGVPGLGGLKDFLKENRPDIVLMHLGSNDIFEGDEIPDIIEELKGILNTLITSNHDVIILIAQILPVADKRINVRIRLLNDAISLIPSELAFSKVNIIVVNQFEGFDPFTDTYDGVHPNSAGEVKMAKKWFEGLQGVLR